MRIMNRAEWISETRDLIEIEAPGKTDFFIDVLGTVEKNDAPFYYETCTGDFTVRTRVTPLFQKTYDAGGILVLDSTQKWIKLEFELTDLGYPSIVSVVTDGVSDDCNGERAALESMWLKVARRGDVFALHFSEDGKKWKMSRLFRLKMKKTLKVGIEVQSPRGRGCTACFSTPIFKPEAPKDLRKGR